VSKCPRHAGNKEEIKMKFFVDTANIGEINELNTAGLIDGVTTNPSLIKKAGRDFKEIIAEICQVTDGDVSAEVIALDQQSMIEQGKVLAKIANNVVVKLPLTGDGLKACRALTSEGIKTNVTLCFSANQGLLAAKAGATYISPFIGRIDDIHTDGMELINHLRVIYDNYDFDTQILAASIRTPLHVRDSALYGADVTTVPPAVLWGLLNHPLTAKGLDQFVEDAKAADIKI
jgi:transaldolase